MRVRRCTLVAIELRERVEFRLEHLSSGGSGLSVSNEWVAMIPHCTAECVVSAEEFAALQAISPSQWSEWDSLTSTHASSVLETLLEKQLLVVEGSPNDERDAMASRTHWRPISAVAHYASRWRGASTTEAQRQFSDFAEKGLLDHLGVPPPAVRPRSPQEQRQKLPAAAGTPLDVLLDARVTCRNYDTSSSLPLDTFAAILWRAFGARVVDDYAPGIQLLKKGVPSAGGLHPTEAYLLVQRVQGVAPGLYHYHPVDHALEPLRILPADDVTSLAGAFVAQQGYFAEAHVMVIAASRFHRNFWKYRNHAKAYRALILDVGHLSQTLYLAATELGLAAFITAAINEIDIEDAFGLDPLEEGPLAVCGFGYRGAERSEVEFDPLHAVWPA